MVKPIIYCVFDCDDINPLHKDSVGHNNIKKLKELFPEITITYYTPLAWHGHRYDINDIRIPNDVEIACHGYLHLTALNDAGECEFISSIDYISNIMNVCEKHYENKLVRPPGWLMTKNNETWLLNNDWLIAGHSEWYDNLEIININSPTYVVTKENIILHSHIEEHMGENSISNQNNFNNLVQWIYFLKENYEVKWITSYELYKRCNYKQP